MDLAQSLCAQSCWLIRVCFWTQFFQQHAAVLYMMTAVSAAVTCIHDSTVSGQILGHHAGTASHLKDTKDKLSTPCFPTTINLRS